VGTTVVILSYWNITLIVSVPDTAQLLCMSVVYTTCFKTCIFIKQTTTKKHPTLKITVLNNVTLD